MVTKECVISMRIKNVNPKGWYDIPGYDGIYQINYWADIRKKLGNGKYKHLKSYVKKNNQGKRLIKLKRKEVVVMSLMRITFIGDLPKGYVTYHKNGIKTDDILGNIGVITKKELSKKTGQMNGRATKVAKINQDGEIVAFYKSAREAARQNYMSYQTILDDSGGSVITGYELSSVITINIDGKEIQSCGDTCIFEQNGLKAEVNFTQEDIQSQSTGAITDNTIIAGIVNKYKNSFGKSRVVVIKSQLGQPITAYSGDKVYWKIPQDLPKMTKLMIDGKALYIHRANFQIIDKELLK